MANVSLPVTKLCVRVVSNGLAVFAQPNQPLLSMRCCFRGERALCFGGLGVRWCESIKARTPFSDSCLFFTRECQAKLLE